MKRSTYLDDSGEDSEEEAISSKRVKRETRGEVTTVTKTVVTKTTTTRVVSSGDDGVEEPPMVETAKAEKESRHSLPFWMRDDEASDSSGDEGDTRENDASHGATPPGSFTAVDFPSWNSNKEGLSALQKADTDTIESAQQDQGTTPPYADSSGQDKDRSVTPTKDGTSPVPDGAPAEPANRAADSTTEGTVHPFTSFKCRAVARYRKEAKISEGGYGVVSKARDMKTNRKVALKKIKFGVGQGKAEDGVHISALREITTLLSISHANVVTIYETVLGERHDEIFLVMEFIEHDVRKLITNKSHKGLGHTFTIPQVKCLMQQLLAGVGYLHSRWVIHRDLKTNNLLYSNFGVLKLCDFGMARLSGEPLRAYTPLQWVLTLPFRPPEGLLGASRYDESTDMWGVGCIFAELLVCKPLFHPGNHSPEVDMLDQIFSLLGTPTAEEWPDLPILLRADPDPFVSRMGEQRYGLNIAGFQLKKVAKPSLHHRFGSLISGTGIDLLSKLLSINPARRINATDAFHHPWFSENPAACSPCDMPQFPVG